MNEIIRDEYRGKEALDHISKYLKKVKSDPNLWQTEYIDIKTGKKWLLDYPNSELQGGGEARLKKIL